MNTYFDANGGIDEFDALLRSAMEDPATRGLMIFAADENGFTAQAVDPFLQRLKVPVLGGIFPQIIHDGRHYAKGTLIVSLPYRPHVCIVPGLSDNEMDFENWLDQHLPLDVDEKTIFVWVDGLASRIGALVEALFNVAGSTANYLGGGAGSLTFEQKPCLFTNNGLVSDVALVALTNMESRIGVKHGWSALSGPYKVTESEGHVIRRLDGRAAFDLYRDVIKQTTGAEIGETNFFELAKRHPFGIKRLDAEDLVRDPIMVDDDDCLVCVGDVPTEAFVDILQGSRDDLITAASEALLLAQDGLTSTDKCSLLLIDCISRVLYLEDEFSSELDAVIRAGTPMFGALTIGEIANNGFQFLEFYNKTVVVGLLLSEKT